MADSTRHIASTVGTIPAGTAITGTVTVSPDRDDVLIYTGAYDLSALVDDGNSGFQGRTWIYVPSATTKVTRLYGVYLNDDGTWSITVGAAMTGVAAASFEIIVNNLLGYSFQNVGSAAGTVDGTSFAAGLGASFPPPDSNNDRTFGRLKVPVYVDASSTDFLITETT